VVRQKCRGDRVIGILLILILLRGFKMQGVSVLAKTESGNKDILGQDKSSDIHILTRRCERSSRRHICQRNDGLSGPCPNSGPNPRNILVLFEWRRSRLTLTNNDCHTRCALQHKASGLRLSFSGHLLADKERLKALFAGQQHV
jgi:hypothetical protein